jgi:hypothetical protein
MKLIRIYHVNLSRAATIDGRMWWIGEITTRKQTIRCANEEAFFAFPQSRNGLKIAQKLIV